MAPDRTRARKLASGGRGWRGEEDDSISQLTRLGWRRGGWATVEKWRWKGSSIEVVLELEQREMRAVGGVVEYGGDASLLYGPEGVQWPTE
jgi:hypothetical protein